MSSIDAAYKGRSANNAQQYEGRDKFANERSDKEMVQCNKRYWTEKTIGAINAIIQVICDIRIQQLNTMMYNILIYTHTPDEVLLIWL